MISHLIIVKTAKIARKLESTVKQEQERDDELPLATIEGEQKPQDVNQIPSEKVDNKVDGQLRMFSRWKSRDGERDKFRQRDGDGFRIRAAALVIKGTGKESTVLLVSGGKDGAKWVIPGGGVEKDENSEEAAHRELLEEAGVRAKTVRLLGTFQDDVRKHRTAVYLMTVAEELQTWEENEYGRQRIWMNLDESAEKVKQAHRPIIEAIIAR